MMEELQHKKKNSIASLKSLLRKPLMVSTVARVFVVGLIVALALVPAGTPTATTARVWQEASSYNFSVVGWHVKNLPSRLLQTVFGAEALLPREERLAFLNRYFETVVDISRAEAELNRVSALQAEAEMTQAQEKLDQLRRQRQDMTGQVESIVKADISQALLSTGTGVRSALRWQFVFPPVIVALQRSPQLLVVSSRSRIDRLEDVLLVPDMSLADKEELEDSVLRRFGLSALVTDTGGIGTYPSIVDNRSDFYYTYVAAAHEWTHNYLTLYPLGRSYFKSGAMTEVNEGVADIVGYEIADEIYRSYGREPPSRPVRSPGEKRKDEVAFDFNAEMRETRLTVDRLLSEGKVEEAEGYMEERRQLFVTEGYYIRKLNQAYFAFYGTYASGPGSVSPVGEQLRELRQRFSSLADFLQAVQGMSSYDQLQAVLVQ